MANEPEEKLVYLACHQIFHGPSSQVRKLKTIKALIKQNKAKLADILREHNVQQTSKVVKKLLESQVFDSTLNAKARFPDLFDVSLHQNSKRGNSETEAMKDKATPVEQIAEEGAVRDMVILYSDNYGEGNSASQQGLESESGSTVPPLYPVFLRYRDQHAVLTTLQTFLEKACFEFAQESFPRVLEQHGWDSFEAIELTEWLNILAKYQSLLSRNLTKPFDKVSCSLCELRHSAVHRIPKTTAGIEQIAENAQVFLEALNDSVRSLQLGLFRKRMRSTIEVLQLRKDVSERTYLAQLEQIRTKRAELDKWEKEAIETLVREDRKVIGDIGKEIAMTVERVQSNEINSRKGKSKMGGNEDASERSFGEVRSEGTRKEKRPETARSACEESLDSGDEGQEVFFEVAMYV
ncbi:unnamed protein product [Penicillium salamii]|uniref:Uncharacterized protein n=1 Tax=Penicillium salamii TaxID=1612424 RepID=A0A9W4N6E6_9EURO|nr:unnamed protein product [Penicillium salamii]